MNIVRDVLGLRDTVVDRRCRAAMVYWWLGRTIQLRTSGLRGQMHVNERDILAIELEGSNQGQAGVLKRAAQFLTADGGHGFFQCDAVCVVEEDAADIAAGDATLRAIRRIDLSPGIGGPPGISDGFDQSGKVLLSADSSIVSDATVILNFLNSQNIRTVEIFDDDLRDLLQTVRICRVQGVEILDIVVADEKVLLVLVEGRNWRRRFSVNDRDLCGRDQFINAVVIR